MSSRFRDMTAIKQIEKKYGTKISKEDIDAIDDRGFVCVRTGNKVHFEKIEILRFPQDLISYQRKRDWKDEF